MRIDTSGETNPMMGPAPPRRSTNVCGRSAGRRTIQLVIEPDGSVRCLYGEEIDLACIGRLAILRASHVELDASGGWLADLAPLQGPVLGPFCSRSEAWRRRLPGSRRTG